LIAYLVANRATETWIVAAPSSQQGAAIQLATGQPVMVIGGFSGGDNALSVDQLKAYIAGGQLRYVLVGGGGGPADLGVQSEALAWTVEHGTPISGVAGGSLYDLSNVLQLTQH
jgi:hypothetical protein